MTPFLGPVSTRGLAVHWLITSHGMFIAENTEFQSLLLLANGPRRLDAPRATLLALLLVLSCVLGHKAESKY